MLWYRCYSAFTLDRQVGRDTLGRGLDVRLGVRNLAKSNIRYPDYPVTFGPVGPSYPEGYPGAVRQMWPSVAYAFLPPRFVVTPMSYALIRLLAGVICLSMALRTGSAIGASPWQEDEQRLRVGLRVFAAALGAQEALAEKRSPGGYLKLVVVCEEPAEAARQAASDLRGIGQIRGLPLSVTTVSTTALDKYGAGPISGIFVASVGVGAQRLRSWSERYRTLVFSPFSGDVEAGAVAGIYVADQILPYVNIAQAKRAGVEFKAFFLRVARQHE